MSGGTAYVLDEAGDFARRCNMAMVELEPVPDEDAASEESRGELESHGKVRVNNLGRSDDEVLRELIEKHLHYTGSARAKLLLDNWARYRPLFVKVMPMEYRRALQEMAIAQKVEEHKMMRASHG